MASLAECFEPRRNALNAVRLILAVGVIAWHSFPLTGHTLAFEPAKQLMGSIFVDGFFAISGFLILSSWTRNPNWWAYLQARVLRIMPAYFICLILTAAVFSPVSVWIAGTAFSREMASSGVLYIVQNSLLKIRQYGIAGTLTNVPYPNVWDGSLWTLWWEFLCYLGILGLGLATVLRFRATLPTAFVLCLAAITVVTIHPTGNNFLNTAPRFALMFLAGSLMYSWQARLPASWRLVAVAVTIVAASSVVPDYRLIAALPLAYAVICIGALLKARWLRLPNDLSYGVYIYAFPVQQILATMGLFTLGVGGFFLLSTVATIPLAAASWFVVERPALRLKKSRRSRPNVSAPAEVASRPADVGPAAERLAP